MVQPKSSKGKPEKPYPEFPLTPYSNGQWVRKIRGKIHCFGPWADSRGALEKHNREYPYLKAGVPVPGKFDGPTVQELINDFLNHKQAELEAGVISARWLKDLHDAGKAIVAVINKTRPVESLGPDDFAKLRLALLKKHSPAIAKNMISRIKSVFKFAKDTRKIERDVDLGVSFKPPAKSLIRRHRATKPKQLWTAEDFRTLLKHATPVRKAMLLLSVNCAFNGADIAGVPIQAFDLKSGWLDFPRTKSGVERRIHLWPETVAAIRDYLKERPIPASETNIDLMFVTRWGKQWTTSGIGHELVKLQEISKVKNGTLLWGRKTLQTIGESSGDIIAVRAVMGHIDDSMSAEYRQEINDQRLKRVTDQVRLWLFPQPSPLVMAATKVQDTSEILEEDTAKPDQQLERLENIENWAMRYCTMFQELRLLHSSLMIRFARMQSAAQADLWDDTPEKLYRQLVARAQNAKAQFERLECEIDDFDLIRSVYRTDDGSSNGISVNQLKYPSIPDAIKKAFEMILWTNSTFDFRTQQLTQSKPQAAKIEVYEPLFYYFFGQDNHGAIPARKAGETSDSHWLNTPEFIIDQRISVAGIESELATSIVLLKNVVPNWQLASAEEWAKRLGVKVRQIRRWIESRKTFIRRLGTNQYEINLNDPVIVEKRR